jgi:GalNAc-alpha-(1->4)-GalNAc-alpha-(1->3)-diNAcBac-PP-undecaprenol alpha-1,4-N-acetyl-D-galactosaminyltransferase
MKVTLAIYGLSWSGGAERVMSIIANYWASQGWDITLLVLADTSSFYPLDPRIKVEFLNIAKVSTNIPSALINTWRRIAILRQRIIASQPEVVISFMNTINVYSILACWNLPIPTIVCEHIYPGFSDANKIWQSMMNWAYRHADLVTVLTQNALPFYPPRKGYRAIVMPNPVLEPPAATVTERLLPTPSLVAMGRLHPQKGFDLLLKAFARLQHKHPDWQLTILGEGALRSELEALRAELKLTECVHFPGSVKNVPDYLRQADLFVMSSRFEGFPMALCEAMACGLPVLSTNCLSGPSDIISDGVNGSLVATEDVEALATGLDALMSDPDRRRQLAANAPQILDRFGLEQVMKLWDEAIDRAIARKRD